MVAESPRMSSPATSWRRVAVVTALISLLLLLAILSPTEIPSKIKASSNLKKLISSAVNNAVIISSTHRKLLSPPVDKPARFWDDTNKCTESDIQVNQGPGAPLPSGIPTYTVEITNSCITGCLISDIHIHCGWFSSAHLIDPSIFKRVHYNDCLVNGGKPLQSGQAISFQYANTRSYPLAVSSMSCV